MMQKYKNFHAIKGLVLAAALLIAVGVVGFGGGFTPKAHADSQCPTGFTYSAAYRTCLGPVGSNGQCPAGSKKGSFPPPNICTATPGSGLTNTGGGSGGGTGTTTTGGSSSSGSGSSSTPTFNASTAQPGAGQYTCGEGADAVHVSINFGCQGKGSAITDAAFAIIRVLSAGVGLVVIASIVVAGIQYTTSRGDPNATARAISRIRSSVIALLIYIFAAAMLDFVIPAGFFK